jgi:signal transduction histidine kinase
MKPELRIMLLYIVVGFAYILTSDMILYALVEDPWLMSQIQSYKGIAYVIFTGFMLYALSSYYFKQQKTFHETIIQREKDRQKEIIHILELERNRFAVELHDNIQQQLAGIHIFFEALQGRSGEQCRSFG